MKKLFLILVSLFMVVGIMAQLPIYLNELLCKAQSGDASANE